MPGPYPPYLWPEGKRCAFCVSIEVDAVSPCLWSPRDAAPAGLGVLETRRYGPRVGIWRILDLLDRHDMKASLYVPGHTAENLPELLPAFVGAGHEVGLLGRFHELAPESGGEEFAAALDASLGLFERQIGERPRGFRSPGRELTSGMIASLKAEAMAYDSSLSGFDHPYEIDGLVEIPMQWANDDAAIFACEGQGRDRWPPLASGQLLEGWLDEWRIMQREGGLFMLTLHDWISGRGQRIAVLERLLETVTAAPDAWIATAGELALWHGHSANRGQFAVQSELPDPIGPTRFQP
jgi:peptidoglycan-N-acetylglucosamine deacetylase